MLAVKRGGASVDHIAVGEVPEPHRGDGEVLIRMEAAAMNPHDLGITTRHPEARDLDQIPGRDLVGIVEQGPAELTGKRVWATGGELGSRRNGFQAELVALPAAAVRRVPDRLTAEQAATVGVAYSTAWYGLVELGRLNPGDVAIVGATTGAVGSSAVQLARWLEASQVVGMVRKPEDAAEVTAIGATHVVADTEDIPARIAEITTRGANVALDSVGGRVLDTLIHCMAPAGRIVTLSASGNGSATIDLRTFYRAGLELRGLNSGTRDIYSGAAVLEAISNGFESGALKPLPIAARFPLSQAADAYQLLATRPRGKVVLTPG